MITLLSSSWSARLVFLLWIGSIGFARGVEPMAIFGHFETNVAAGARLELPILYLNSDNQELKAVIPERLNGLLRPWGSEANLKVSFTCKDPGATTIPAHSFIQRKFEGLLPTNSIGALLLEIPGAVQHSVLLLATPSLAITTSTTPPKKESDEKKSEISAVKTDRKLDSSAFFRSHFYPYESFYFIACSESPNAKFQISFKYRLIREGSVITQKAPPVEDIYFGYTQTSLWDLNKPSAPFLDTSYKPEVFYYRPILLHNTNNTFRLDLQSGIMHESNGRDGAFSRSLNIVYLRPTVAFGKSEGLQFSISPRIWFYADSLEDNRDLDRYRGYMDIRTVLSWREDIRLSTMLRAGDHFDKGSVQVDFTYPFWKIIDGLTIYLHAQFFTGYGESLLLYKDRVSMIRAGFALFP